MKKNKKDNYVPDGDSAWEFNEEVTEVFPNMLSRSIPEYDTMRELIYRIGRNFIKEGSTVLDVGCSTGLSAEKLIGKYKGRANFVLTDISQPMLKVCREKYHEEILEGNVAVKYSDLREGVPIKGCSLIVSCLTLQFTPIEYRQFIIQNLYDSLESGGALLLIEKVLGNSHVIDETLVHEYYDIKRENAYTEEQIASKRRSLEGTLVPLTCQMNELFLRNAGFNCIDTFWRYLNFCGIMAIKKV